MTESRPQSRRQIITAGLTVAAATLGDVVSPRQADAAQSSGPAMPGSPASDRDDWLDTPALRHRILFDTTTSAGLGQALSYADVYFRINKSSYGVEATDLGVLVLLHHISASFGFDDVIWSKYGAILSEKGDQIKDPRTQGAPAVNVFNAKDITSLNNGRITLDSLSAQGARFPVCDVATHGLANMLARMTHASADTIYAELKDHLVRGAFLVPSGVTTINRAQEHGYSYAVAI